ncbi:MAG: radical SAM protein [Holophagales bacterium]|nr:radical SAM protein [Holophagales bacterium]
MNDPFAHAGLLGVKQRALDRAMPLSAYLELTYACTWRCLFCSNPRRHDIQRLSAAQWLPVLDDLRLLGALVVTLTGGEPLAHPEFFAIARGVRQRAMALRLFTNGSLVDRDVARALTALRPLSVELSLHGATAVTHDRTTGREGSFAATLSAIDHLQAAGATLLLKAPLTGINEGELDELLALAECRGIPIRVDPTLKPGDDGNCAPLAYGASRAGVAALYQRLAAVGQLPQTGRAAGGVNCGLGRTTVAIDPEGNVFPCMQWRHSDLGNVCDTPLTQLWRGGQRRAAATAIADQANEVLLALGEPMASFPFCPAAAVLEHGDPLAVGESFVRHASLARELRSPA